MFMLAYGHDGGFTVDLTRLSRKNLELFEYWFLEQRGLEEESRKKNSKPPY